MANQLRFDGKVAIITGAGGGLGKAYALAFAKRGAKVVVNDLGGNTRGEGKDTSAADKVVEEIKAAGGEAVANYDSVTDGAKIVKTAIDKWGRVDIVVNNAGILRDVTFHKMTDKDWDLLYQVHLRGSFAVTKAAWPYMRDQKYGRIIMVTSAAGLYGNFGQSHYSTVKMGLVGFANTLAKEGAKLNIHANVIAPLAGSRMTAQVMPPDLVQALKPEYVSPLVEFLCHDSCKENGGVFEVGAGWIAKLRWERGKGGFFPLNDQFTPELVSKLYPTITDFSEPAYPNSVNDSMGVVMSHIESFNAGNYKPAALPAGATAAAAAPAPAKEKKEKKGGKGGNSKVDVEKVLAYTMPKLPFAYTDRDVILYALGVGAAADPLDPKELRFVYEMAPDFQVLPTFGVVVPSAVLGNVAGIPGLEFNPMMLLHGEQFMEVKKPLPTAATLTSEARVAHLYDKGKGALLVLQVKTYDESGAEVLFNQYSLFIRGLGGFGGDKGPKDDTELPPKKPPQVVHREQTLENQALLYRLSGDRNPLHADPAMAAMGGFKKPILHGLCTFGYATRAVLKHFCDNDASKFRSIRVRFVNPVIPGETIVTEMWRSEVKPNQILFRCKIAERGIYVLDGGVITLQGDASAAPAAAPASAGAPASDAKAAAPAGNFQASAVFAELAKRVDATLVGKVKATYKFDITNKDKQSQSWFVDLKTGSGSVKTCDAAQKADCSIALSDEDFVKLMNGKLNAQQAFMQGQLKIKGNMMLAQKLSLLNAKPAAL